MPRPSLYNITVQTGGQTYTSKDTTIEKALEKMNLTWENIKLKGVMTVKKGKLKHEHLFNVIQLRRIFVNKFVRIQWARNINFLMK